jgi:hypothetical protein
MARSHTVWQHVRILQDREKGDPEILCSLCDHKSTAGVTRLKAHFLGISGEGIKRCEPEEEENKAKLKELKEQLGKEAADKASTIAGLTACCSACHAATLACSWPQS